MSFSSNQIVFSAMEHKYFLLLDNNKKDGPFNLTDLQKKSLKSSTQVWRDDFLEWKSINDVKELENCIYYEPPLTKREKNQAISDKEFKTFFLNLILYFIISSIFIATISTLISSNSWGSFKSKIEAKYPETSSSANSSSSFSSSENSIPNSFNSPFSSVSSSVLIDYNRYPQYQSAIMITDLENSYGSQQILFGRVYKSIFSTVYLTKDEQERSSYLFFTLLLSAIFTNSPIFLILIALKKYQFLFNLKL